MSDETYREEEFTPNLSEKHQSRFDALTDELIEFQEPLDREVAIRDEIRHIENEVEEEVTEDQTHYLAGLEVLLDLIEINYDIRKNSELKIVRPDPDRYKRDPEQFKKQERAVLQKERRAQFQEESVRGFVRKMERNTTRNTNGGRSVLDLITNGEELYEDLAPLQDKSQNEIVENLTDIVQPYIQKVKTRKNVLIPSWTQWISGVISGIRG